MGDKPKHDQPVMIIIGLMTILLFCFLFWLALSDYISSGVRWLRVGQLQIISLFTDEHDQLLRELKQLNLKQVSPLILYVSSVRVLEVLRLPIAVIFAGMALYAFFMKEKHPYKRKMDIESLIVEHATAFPVTSPIVKFNPLKASFRVLGGPVPEKLPPFAEALAPEEWVSFHNIPVSKHPVTGTIEVEQQAARTAFARQLGTRWKNVQDLPVHAQALFAAFAMKAAGQRTESDEFLGEIALCWKGGAKLVLTPKLRKKIKDVITDPKEGRVLEKIAALHAFVTPAMMRCLLHARERGGVLAPAQFLWLRAVDRTLWYPLNNLGRGALHSEAAGATAHFRAEKAANKPIPNPQVDPAITGLVKYLRDNDIDQFPPKEFGKAA